MLQFLHVHLRANDAWTVPVEPPAPPVAAATFAELLATDDELGDEDDEDAGDTDPEA